MTIEIPHYGRLDIRHIVCDYNGTIAKDGHLLPGIKELFDELSRHCKIHVVTADTFGSVRKELEKCDVAIEVLQSDDHTHEKAAFVESLGCGHCVSLGNGNNDVQMLRASKLGIVIVGDEGCSGRTLAAADIVCRSVSDALELFVHPKRLIATLRC